MGVKASKSPKPELNRSKSITSFGRSSQRSLFQKSKIKLNQIDKQLQKYEEKGDSSVLEKLKKQLEDVEKDLNGISQAIKEKNKQKYDDVLKCFEETRQKFEDKTKTTSVEENSNLPGDQEDLKPQNVQQPVELTLVEVNSAEDPGIELRNPEINLDNEDVEQPKSPKVKFGVQVMPVNPRVSQELLKRKTLPSNEVPKAEFLHIRRRAESDGNQQNMDNQLYNELLKQNVVIQNNEPNTSSIPSSPSSKSKQEKPLKELEKRQVNVNALQKIELITADVDILEDRLKYFHGVKGDGEYLVLRELFVRNLVKLDNVEAQGDPVVRQERKILVHRIQELIKILECLVEQPVGVQEPNVEEDSGYDYVEKRHEEVANAEGKPITATAL